MSDYTVAEIEAAFGQAVEDAENNDDSKFHRCFAEGSYFWEELAWYAKSDYAKKNYPDPVEIELRGEMVPVEVVDSDTGGEGHGQYVYVVVKIGDQLFRQDGNYFSHYGTDWDGGLYAVTAKEKTITVYE